MNDYCWHIPRPLLSPSTPSTGTASTASEDHQHQLSQQQNVDPFGKTIGNNYNYQSHKALSPTQSTVASSNENNSSQGQQNKALKLSDLEESSKIIVNINDKMPTSNKSSLHLSTSSILSQNNNKNNNSSSSNNSSNKSITSNTSSIPNKNHNKIVQSDQSTRSCNSNSLLLTAANLERFIAINRREHQQITKYNNNNKTNQLRDNNHRSINYNNNANYSSNLLHYAIKDLQQFNRTTPMTTSMRNMDYVYDYSYNYNNITNNNTNNKINNNYKTNSDYCHDANLNFIKTKDLDAISAASSMHFTMINIDTDNKKNDRKGLCDHGRQVTVLIISMSIILLLLIISMVYALEMRARDMPKM